MNSPAGEVLTVPALKAEVVSHVDAMQARVLVERTTYSVGDCASALLEMAGGPQGWAQGVINLREQALQLEKLGVAHNCDKLVFQAVKEAAASQRQSLQALTESQLEETRRGLLQAILNDPLERDKLRQLVAQGDLPAGLLSDGA